MTTRFCAITLGFLFSLCLLTPAFAVDESIFEDYPDPACTEAIVVDEFGNVLYHRDGYTSMPMASTTKMMTAILALESGIDLETACYISEYADEVEGSVVDYSAGQTPTLYDLLRGLLIHSGNDCAIAIAENVAADEASFVDMMNAKAYELGLTGTHYVNPHGLDEEGHYSTPADLVTLARYAWANPLFRTICGTQSVTLDVNGSFQTIESTDALLNTYPGMRGIKTGYTYGAGNAFVGCATKDGITLFSAVLGCETSAERFSTTWYLLDWAFDHYASSQLLDEAPSNLGSSTFADRFGWQIPIEYAYMPEERVNPFHDNSGYSSEHLIERDVLLTPEDSVGTVRWYQNGDTFASVAVVSGIPEYETPAWGTMRDVMSF